MIYCIVRRSQESTAFFSCPVMAWHIILAICDSIWLYDQVWQCVRSQRMIRSRKDFIPCAPIDTHFAGHSVSARFEQSNGDVYEGAFDKGAAHGQGCMVCGFVIFDVLEKRCMYSFTWKSLCFAIWLLCCCFARPAQHLPFRNPSKNGGVVPPTCPMMLAPQWKCFGQTLILYGKKHGCRHL